LTLSQNKIETLLKFDKKFTDNSFVIGTDEAGRGPLAGPVVAAAVYFKKVDKEVKSLLKLLNDSKKLTHKIRGELYGNIKEFSYFSIQEASVEEIEKNNILRASLLTMKRSVENVMKQVSSSEIAPVILVDGNFIIPNLNVNQKAVIKGDSKSASIAAASILAKVYRDELMIQLHLKFPHYNWQKNKGYGTKEHIKAIDEFGICEFHRKSFLKKYYERSQQISLF